MPGNANGTKGKRTPRTVKPRTDVLHAAAAYDAVADAESENTGETIPKAEHLRRMRAARDINNKLKTQLTEVIAENATLVEATNTAEEAAAEVETMREELETHRTRAPLLELGITNADDADTILQRYNKLDPDKRPELAAWLASDKGAKADRICARILADVKAPADGGGAGGAGKPPGGRAGGAGGEEGDPEPTGARPPPKLKNGAGLTLEAIDKLSPAERVTRNAEIQALIATMPAE